MPGSLSPTSCCLDLPVAPSSGGWWGERGAALTGKVAIELLCVRGDAKSEHNVNRLMTKPFCQVKVGSIDFAMAARANMDLAKENITPYFSILIAKIDRSLSAPQLHVAISSLISMWNEVGSSLSEETVSMQGPLIENINDSSTVCISKYLVYQKPSWTNSSEYMDTLHHVHITIKSVSHVALYFSESGLKDKVRDEFGKGSLIGVSPISMDVLNGNFINEDQIKMLWLSGIHGRNSFKADSKVLGGENVADTLDPLIDQSYMMSAVRTGLANLQSSMGINPFKSSVWCGPCNSWAKFESMSLMILDKVESGTENANSPISILSFPLANSKELNEPYDFSLVDPEFYPDEGGSNRKKILERLYDGYQFELMEAFKDCISLKISVAQEHVGDVTVKPILVDYKVGFTIENQRSVKGKAEKIKDVLTLFSQYPDLVKCWYESGHAIVSGMVFRTGYRDVVYGKFIWADFENYEIEKEKPGKTYKNTDLTKIGEEKSLFCWVRNRWNGDWIESKDFNTTETPTGWLYCDDGAGEKADFIHLTEFEGKHLLSLIHVKAAKSGSKKRKISVGAHDVVLSQAVKNIRYLDRKRLIVGLGERLSTKIDKCWKDGKPASSELFLDHLKAIENASKIFCRVIVVQPHTLQSVYEKQAGGNIRKQLDVLLVSADNAIRSANAEFHVIGSATRA